MNHKQKIVLFGAGGHCKSVIDVIETEGKFQIAGIIDMPERVGDTISGYPVIGTDNDIRDLVKEYQNFIITVGHVESPAIRIKLFNELKKYKANLPVIISPFARVSKSAAVNEGTVVMHHALINANAKVGKNCIINSKALIEHDAIIKNYCHISTGAIINGACLVREECLIGSGTVLLQSLRIAARTITGAGAIVTKDITESGVYVGSPAIKVKC